LVRSGFMTTGCIRLGEIHFICITYTESKLTIPYCVSFKPPRLPIRFALGIHPSYPCALLRAGGEFWCEKTTQSCSFHCFKFVVIKNFEPWNNPIWNAWKTFVRYLEKMEPMPKQCFGNHYKMDNWTE
jgi:hypothetical protein